MKEKFKLYGSILILVIFVPYLVTLYLQGGGLLFSPKSSAEAQEEAQVVQLVAKEMPAAYETECLRAQAVIARTNLRRQQETGGQTDIAGQASSADADQIAEQPPADADQIAEQPPADAGQIAEQPSADAGQTTEQPPTDTGWTTEQMRAAWGEDYERNLEKIENAVSSTEGEVLTYKGKLINAAYHAASNKKTRSASEVPGQEDAAGYLAGVDSEADILADHFLYIGYMEKQKFADALRSVFEGETLDAGQLPGTLQIAERDSADYVTKVKYGKTTVNGEAVRAALGLNSACFYFSELEGQVRIVTKGLGHGLGFSQYGANELAKRGDSYRDLLHYYYQDIEIKRVKK